MSIAAIASAKVLKGIAFHSALGSNYLALGRVTGVSILALSLYLISAAKTRPMKLIGCALVGLNLFGLLYSGGKGPLLTLVVTMLAVLVFYMNRREAKKYIVVVLLLSLTTVVLMLALPGYFDTIKYRLSVIDPFRGVDIRESSAAQRLDMFDAAVNAMADYPILGTGLGGFSDYSGYGSGIERAYYPHNIFLEIGSELGIFGLLAFVALISFCLLRLFRYSRLRGNLYHLVCAVFALFLYMLMNASVSGDVNDKRSLF
jgi:O-antigen ligase